MPGVEIGGSLAVALHRRDIARLSQAGVIFPLALNPGDSESRIGHPPRVRWVVHVAAGEAHFLADRGLHRQAKMALGHVLVNLVLAEARQRALVRLEEQ